MFIRLLNLGLVATGLTLLTGCATTGQQYAVNPQNPGLTLRLIGETTLPHKTEVEGTVFGGISGIDYDAKRDVYYLISDDRSQLSPARFYVAKLPLTSEHLGAPQLRAAVTLKKADGMPYGSPATDPLNTIDPEAIRYRHRSDTLFWSSEGDKRLGLSPHVRESRLDGSLVRELPTLPMFRMQSGEQGPRDNNGFEGLAFASGQQQLWVAMEAARFEDGALAQVGQRGGDVRLTVHDVETGAAIRQIAYPLDPIPRAPSPADAFADNGISEILMLDRSRMLVLERSYAQGRGNSLRLYLIDVRDGSDTLGLIALQPGGYTPVTKSLVLDFDALQLPRLDNSEGMTLGPRLSNGNRTLIVASDDNFNPQQINQFLAFELIEPQSWREPRYDPFAPYDPFDDPYWWHYGYPARYGYWSFGWSWGWGRPFNPPPSAIPMPKRP